MSSRAKEPCCRQRVANGAYQRLLEFVWFIIEVAAVKEDIEAFTVPGNTSYSLILGRPWLRSLKAIGLYKNDEYWTQDAFREVHRWKYQQRL